MIAPETRGPKCDPSSPLPSAAYCGVGQTEREKRFTRGVVIPTHRPHLTDQVSEVEEASLPHLQKEEMILQMHLALAEHSSFQRALGGQTSSQLE